MLISRKDAKEQLQEYKQMFAPIIGKPVIITFDKHIARDVIITDLDLVKTTGLKNAPNKRIIDDKHKTPMLFQIVADQCTLQFVFDDTTVSAITNGVRLSIQQENTKAIEVDIRGI
jgi:hypothetical protein